MSYKAVLHSDTDYDGISRVGATPKEAADKLAQTLSGYTDIKFVADFRCNTPGTGHVYRRFMPNLGHRVTITKEA